MNRMKPHLRRVPAKDIRRGDLIYLTSERGLCRVVNQYEVTTLSGRHLTSVIEYSVLGNSYNGIGSSVHCKSAWKVVGLDGGRVMAKTDRRVWREKQLASLLNDVRNYPSETVDGLHN